MTIVASGLGRPGQGAIVARGLGISVLEPEVIPPHVGIDLDEPAVAERAETIEIIERSMTAELDALITEVELGSVDQGVELQPRAQVPQVVDRPLEADVNLKPVTVDLGSYITAVVVDERTITAEVTDRSLTVEVQPVSLSSELGSTSTRRD